MRVAYVFFSGEGEEAACVKNMSKTCEELGKKCDLTVYSSVKLAKMINLYEIEQTFDYFQNTKIFGFGKVFEFLNRLFFSLKVIWLILDGNYDLVYTRDIFFVSIMNFLPLVNFKVVFESHRPFGITSIFPEWLEIKSLRECNQIFCVSEGIIQYFVEKDIDESKLNLQRNGVDLEDYNCDKNNIDSNKYKILYAGSFEPKKGVNYLLKSFKSLNAKYENLELILLGNVQQDTLNKLTDSMDNIKSPGFVPQFKLSDYYCEADLLVLPNIDCRIQRNFTCPMKLLEYMASNTPIIASDLPSARNIAKDTILYFDPGNPYDLSRKIEYTINNENREDKSISTRKIVKENFTWEIKAKNILKEAKNLK